MAAPATLQVMLSPSLAALLANCLSPVKLECTLLGQHAVRYCMIFWVKQQDCGKWVSFQDGMIPPSLTSW